MTAPAATITKVRNRLIDPSVTNPVAPSGTTLQEAIDGAVSRYSRDSPREIVDDVAGSGSNVYPLTGVGAVLADWSEGFSAISAIDFPAAAVSATFRPHWLDGTFDWAFSKNGADIVFLRFTTQVPAVGQTARISYTAPHIHTTVRDTVPTSDLDAVCDLAASYACQALATRAAGLQDSTLLADSTSYRDAQLRYKQQAEAWETSYKRRMGISDGVAGSSAYSDWNRTNTAGGQFLTHNRRWR